MHPIAVQINSLGKLRDRIAEIAALEAEGELTGRILRLTIETELRQKGTTKTDAEKEAKADGRYLAHERTQIQLAYDRAVLEADAESERFGIELQLALMQREMAVVA